MLPQHTTHAYVPSVQMVFRTKCVADVEGMEREVRNRNKSDDNHRGFSWLFY